MKYYKTVGLHYMYYIKVYDEIPEKVTELSRKPSSVYIDELLIKVFEGDYSLEIHRILIDSDTLNARIKYFTEEISENEYEDVLKRCEGLEKSFKDIFKGI